MGLGEGRDLGIESLIRDLGLYSKNVGTSLEDFKQGGGLITCERS